MRIIITGIDYVFDVSVAENAFLKITRCSRSLNRIFFSDLMSELEKDPKEENGCNKVSVGGHCPGNERAFNDCIVIRGVTRSCLEEVVKDVKNHNGQVVE